ncbi:unnamed protein product [Rotaria sordida]|uniref:Uncharacterized protein n=1 Tax=Rotaria sordida TaxID=392033 RepID=A0A813YC48_9BILA|nr:unnamed protein product [Rotaria sordida]CAF0944309.1 unnamed protein product [Rotaria sordida]
MIGFKTFHDVECDTINILIKLIQFKILITQDVVRLSYYRIILLSYLHLSHEYEWTKQYLKQFSLSGLVHEE